MNPKNLTTAKNGAKSNVKNGAKNGAKSTAKSSAKSKTAKSTKSNLTKSKMPNTTLIKEATDSNFLSLMSLDTSASKSIKPPKSTQKASPSKATKTRAQKPTPALAKQPKQPKQNKQILSKQQKIVSMFDKIAKDYDKANHLLSLGIDISWRADACKRAYQALLSAQKSTKDFAISQKNAKPNPKQNLKPNAKQNLKQNPKQNGLMIADIACGTGDMLLQWHKEAKKANITLDTLIGIDPSKQMLKIAQNKIKTKIQNKAESKSTAKNIANSTANSTAKNASKITAKNASKISPKILIKVGEAKDLSALEKHSIDILSISYGLRNVLEYDRALREFARVLKPSGVLVVLDFFKKPNPSLLDRFVGVYTRKILPFVGWAISRNYEAYKYLPDSMDSFVSPQKLAQDLRTLGFGNIQIKGYSANISHLVLGVKS